MSDKHVARVARETDAAVAEAVRRAAAGGDGVDVFTPLDAFIAKEEGESEDEFAEKLQVAGKVLDFLFADGPHPQAVMQRVYLLAQASAPHLLLGMPGRSRSAIFGQGKGAESARTKMLITRTFVAAGYRVEHLPHQKAAGSTEVYAAAQLGNQNRKGTGKKSAKRKAAGRRKGGK